MGSVNVTNEEVLAELAYIVKYLPETIVDDAAIERARLWVMWDKAIKAHNTEAKAKIEQALGFPPITPEIRALAVALHNLPIEALNPGGAAIEAIAKALHSVVV